MRNVLTLIILSGALVACSSGSSRYRDTAPLEKPPTLALQKTPTNVVDDSVEPKRQLGGLDEKVELLDESPKKVLLKQPIMEAWRTIAAALRQSDIKLTDYDKNKHLFYVSYKTQGSGLNRLLGFLSKEGNEVVYLLRLEPKDGGETLIHAALASNHEQQTEHESNPDGIYEAPDEDSDGLIEHLYHVLRDDVKTE
jgi:hypothetical protein